MNFFRSGNGTFSREMTLFSLGFFIFSLLYWIISFCYLNKDYSYTNERYNLLKERYKDLLVEEDINKILSNDSEYKEAKKHFELKRRHYSFFWVITVIFLAFLTYYASDYWSNYSSYYSLGFWKWLFLLK
jgi:hypothetical protein